MLDEIKYVLALREALRRFGVPPDDIFVGYGAGV